MAKMWLLGVDFSIVTTTVAVTVVCNTHTHTPGHCSANMRPSIGQNASCTYMYMIVHMPLCCQVVNIHDDVTIVMYIPEKHSLCCKCYALGTVIHMCLDIHVYSLNKTN